MRIWGESVPVRGEKRMKAQTSSLYLRNTRGAEGGIIKIEDREGLALSWIFVLDFNLIIMGSLKWF